MFNGHHFFYRSPQHVTIAAEKACFHRIIPLASVIKWYALHF
jgi:hypothetical protein